jgi:hypothetical protein
VYSSGRIYAHHYGHGLSREGICPQTPKFGGNNLHGNYDIGGNLINPQTLEIIFINPTNGEVSISLGMSGIDGCAGGFKGAIRICPLPPPPCPDPTNPECPCPNPSNPSCPCPNPSNPDCDTSCEQPLDKCLVYKETTCCNLNCIEFSIDCPTKCENNCGCPECYFVTVQFEDGTVGTINLSFAGQPTLMNCYSKKIKKILSITPYECAACPPDKPKKEAAQAAPKEVKQDMRQNQQYRVQVSPNPAKTILSFKGDQLQNYKLSLYDTQANPVMTGVTVSGSVNIEKLEKGIYIYVITDSAGYRQTGKIIKE